MSLFLPGLKTRGFQGSDFHLIPRQLSANKQRSNLMAFTYKIFYNFTDCVGSGIGNIFVNRKTPIETVNDLHVIAEDLRRFRNVDSIIITDVLIALDDPG